MPDNWNLVPDSALVRESGSRNYEEGLLAPGSHPGPGRSDSSLRSHQLSLVTSPQASVVTPILQI